MNPADILKYGDQFFLRTLDGLPQSEWETGGVCGVWSVKDIVGHLASYEHLLQEVLAPFAGMTMEMPVMSRIGEVGPAAWNDWEVERRGEKSPAEVLAEYTDTYKHTQAQFVPKIPPETWSKVGTLPWYGMEYSLDDYIVYSFYGHKREHSAQIAVFKDQFK
jgi:hypothetical protein